MTSIINIIDNILRSSLAGAWYLMVYYGLNPKMSYDIIISGRYVEFLSSIYNIYYDLFSISIIISSIIYLFYYSLGISKKVTGQVVRYIISVILIISSYMIFHYILIISKYIFMYLWKGTDWYSIFNASKISGYSGLTLLFLNGSYFTGIVILAFSLVVRQAILIIMAFIMPVSPIFILFPGAEKYFTRIIKIVIELSLMPVLTILSLYLMRFFPADLPLQIGFIYASFILPGLIFRTISGFLRQASLFGMDASIMDYNYYSLIDYIEDRIPVDLNNVSGDEPFNDYMAGR
ncbi:hypothetical protein [Picrophilus oshimae]|uniref:Hypothetical membrane protein n=1 Tax=Picrophilus torridus (strain ATCC 700027 / DSM 9790 / JCM 10055 / NBRC 100828 / KAW 2/3) TaxID=1122961 RepID=Q6L0L4_PICTO|nr:hypothetical protein [Picrophilus oshimae]AAT43488.1 hypothetical membrane protein [Picrophilus oshimae DSM 9789]